MNEKVVFRRMIEADVDAVCKIETETFSMPWSYESFLTALGKKENIYLVATVDDQIAGYCGVWCVAGEGQINNVAVAKNYRQRGIGYGILNFLFEEGKKEKLESFTLEVRKSNVAAIGLYMKKGFETVGIRKKFYEKPVEDAVIMTVITSRNLESKPI